MAFGGQRDAAMSRLHAFLVSLQELRSLQAAEADWPGRPTAHGAKPAGSAREPSTGDPIGGTSAWVDPSMPPDTEHFAALDCVRDLRERQQQQAADALLRDAKLRLLQDRLQAQQLQMDGIDQPRHTARCLGNEYLRQAGRQRTGSARGAKPGSSIAQPTRQSAATAPSVSPRGHGQQIAPGMRPEQSLPPGLVGTQEVIARCVEEFGRSENNAADLARYLSVWQAYTSWSSGMYEYGFGFEVPCLGRIVVKTRPSGVGEVDSTSNNVSRKQAEFFGSHRMLGTHGLTQRLASTSDGDFLAAYHRATRVNYDVLRQHCGLHVEDITRRLKEFVWCLLQLASEHPEKDLQIDLGPCVLSCKHRRLSVQFHRPPGNEAHSLPGGRSPPASPPLTPKGDRSPSVLSAVSDASSWTVQSVGSSVAAKGRWARWPLLVAAQRPGSKAASAEPRPFTAMHIATIADGDSAQVAQLTAANTSLATENALLRAKLDRLLHFTTTELQGPGAADATAAWAKPTAPPTPPPRDRPPAARGRIFAVPVAPPIRHCGGNGLVGSSYPAW